MRGSALFFFLLMLTLTQTTVHAEPGRVTHAAGSPAITVDGAFGRLRIDALATDETAPSADAMARLVDPVRLQDWQADLATASARVMRIPRLSLEFGSGETKETIVVEDLEMRGLGHGIVATLSIGRLAASGGSAVVPVSFRSATITRLDLVGLARTLAGTTQDALAPTMPLCDTLAIESAAIGGDPFPITIRAIEAARLRTRRLLVSLWQLTGRPAPTRPMKRALAALAVADVVRSVEAEKLQIREATGGARGGGFKIGSVSLSRLAGGRLGRLAIEGLDFDAGFLRLRFESSTHDDLELKDAIAALEASAGMPDAARLRSSPDLYPRVARQELRNAEMTVGVLPPLRGPSRDKSPTWPPLRLGALRIEQSPSGSARPYRTAWTIDHLATQLPAEDLTPQIALLRKSGFAALDLSGRLDVVWDDAKGDLSIPQLRISDPGLGTFTGRLHLTSVGDDVLSDDEAQTFRAMDKIEFDHLGVRFDDTGLIAKLTAIGAAAVGTTPEATKGNAVELSETAITAILDDTPSAQALVTAVRSFIADPRSLDIDIAAAERLRLGELLDPVDDSAALERRLHVRAVANKPH